MPNSVDQVASRMDQIQQSGYGSIPFQAQAALANSGVSNQDFNTTAAQFHAADIAANGHASYWFDDPVLQKADSPALQIKRYVSAAVGPWPIQVQHVQTIQKQMQKAGYGKDLVAGGAWTPDWYAALNQAKAEQLQKQRGGDTGGFWSDPVGSSLHTLAHALPQGTIDSAVGLIKAIPGQLRSSFEDVLGGGPGDLAQQLATGRPSTGQNLAGAFGRATGDPLVQSGEQYQQQFQQHRWERGFNDLNTALLLTSAVGHAAGIAAAAGERLGVVGQNLSTEEAAQAGGVATRTFTQRAPGQIGRILNVGMATDEAGNAIATGIRPFVQRAAAGAAIGGVVGGAGAGITGNNIAQGALYGAAIGGTTAGLAGTQAVRNMPVLGHIAPVLEHLSDADGAYYAFRNNPSVNFYMKDNVLGDLTRTAGAAVGKAGEFGLKVGIAGDVANQIEGNTGYGAIANETAGEKANTAFVGFQKNVLHAPITASINDLAFLFHTPAGETTLSKTLGRQAGSMVAPSAESVSDLYGLTISRWQGKPVNQVIDELGGPSNFSQAINNRMDQVTARIVAEEDVQKLGLTRGTPDYTAAVQDAMNRAYTDRDALHQMAYQYLSKPGGVEDYATRLKANDLLNGPLSRSGGPTADMPTYVAASDIVKTRVLPHLLTNAANTAEAQGAGTAAAGYADKMQAALDTLKQQTLDAGTPEEAAHYRNLRVTLETAQSHDQTLQVGLREATKTGNQDLINQYQTERAHAADTLDQAISDAHASRPGTIPDSTQMVARQATTDFLQNKTLWSRSLDHQNATNILVNPTLGDRAPDIGIAGHDVLTFEDGERKLKYIQQQWDQANRLETNARQTAGVGGNAVPTTDFAQTEPVDMSPDLRYAQHLRDTAKQNLLDYLFHEMGLHSKDALDVGKVGSDGTEADRFNQVMGYAHDQTKGFARDVTLTPDAPAELLSAQGDLANLGYKLVLGHDIGHDHIPYNLIDATSGQQDSIQRLAGHLGLNWEPGAQSTINMRYKNELLGQFDSLIKSGEVGALPGVDARTLVAASQEIANREKPGLIREFLARQGQKFAANSPVQKVLGNGGINEPLQTRIDQLTAQGLTPKDAEDLAAVQMTQDQLQMHGLRDLSRSQYVARMTDPNLFAELMPDISTPIREANGGVLNRGIAANEAEANRMFLATKRAYTNVPTRMVGLEHLEAMFRSSMGFMGEGKFNVDAHGFNIGDRFIGTPAHQFDLGPNTGRILGGAALGATANVIAGNKSSIGDYLQNAVVGGIGGAAAGVGVNKANEKGLVNADRWGWAASNLPNRLIQARNEWRFALSPMFSLRRQVKTAVKASLNGDVPFELRPYTAMKTMAGGPEAGFATLDRVRPQLSQFRGWDDAADSATRMIEDNDVFGIYNQRANMAHMARTMELQGATDGEIGGALDKTFNYTSGSGANQIIGRSTLERSTNMVFFPFSFDKRLYGAMAGYLLDRPAQQIALTAGLTAFDQFQKAIDANNPLAVKWYENHLPLLQTMEQLNPLAHGVSIGVAGGINRPLLNAFMPQSWHPTQDNNKLLLSYFPAMKDAGTIMGQLAEQGKIFGAASEGMYHMFPGVTGYTNYGNPGPSTLGHYAQLTDAFKIQNSWYNQYAKVLDYNQGKAAVDQVKFPATNDFGKFGGMGITKQTIRDIIQARYPAYDPSKAIAIATTNQEALHQYVENNHGTPLGDYGSALIDSMQKIGTALSNNKVPAKQAAQETDQVRAAAIFLAQKDPTFYKLYQKNFQKMFGPLEEFTNG